MLILSKIPEGISEMQVAASAGRPTEILQVSYRAADLEGLGWCFIAFASPDLAKGAKERLHGKTLPGVNNQPFVLDAVLGEGLYGSIRRYEEQDSAWKEARSAKGEVYYYHAVTRQTSWTKPLPSFPPVPPPPGAGRVPAPPPRMGMLGLAPPPPVAPPPPGAAQAVSAAQAAIQAAQATAGAAQAQALSGGKVGPVGGNLFVYHIPNSWDDNILRQHFEHFGGILSCRIQKDPEGRARGFGFVSYDSAEAGAAAIAGMHGFPVEGKWLKVQLKKGDAEVMAPGQTMSGMEGQMGAPGAPPPPPGLPSNLQAVAGIPQPPPRPGPY
jgi:hypothetical protein